MSKKTPWAAHPDATACEQFLTSSAALLATAWHPIRRIARGLGALQAAERPEFALDCITLHMWVRIVTACMAAVRPSRGGGSRKEQGHNLAARMANKHTLSQSRT